MQLQLHGAGDGFGHRGRKGRAGASLVVVVADDDLLTAVVQPAEALRQAGGVERQGRSFGQPSRAVEQQATVGRAGEYGLAGAQLGEQQALGQERATFAPGWGHENAGQILGAGDVGAGAVEHGFVAARFAWDR